MSSRARASNLRSVLAGNVRAARDARAWSQEQLAERAGLTQVYISQIETSKTSASVDTIEKLAKGLGMDASSLLQAAS